MNNRFHTRAAHRCRLPPIALLACIAAWMCSPIVNAEFHPAPPPAGVAGLAEYSLRFDRARDPDIDIQSARAAASAAGRNILLVVGGDWCVWCFLLDRHFSKDAEAAHSWYGAFEVLRIYYGEDNRNTKFLSHYPDFELFPHFFIVAADGRVLGSSTADVLIRDAKYDNALMREFIRQWSVLPSPKAVAPGAVAP
jgi:thiol:disulfide interchange protein